MLFHLEGETDGLRISPFGGHLFQGLSSGKISQVGSGVQTQHPRGFIQNFTGGAVLGLAQTHEPVHILKGKSIRTFNNKRYAYNKFF